ncbi:MAG: enoyl-CoA hydratase family protein [Armatimonadetes bacterium]|nr:enoyl-CoA hydratase family protein [Armatimonadota bacterium]
MAIATRHFQTRIDPDTGVATVVLARPDRLNALTFEIYEELRDAFLALDREPGVRSILLTGSGRGFCSGGDVEDIIGQLFGRDLRGMLDFTRITGELILAMLRCRRPIVGAINGVAAGAGAVIASACDVRIASETARIAFLFVKVGLSGADMGASWLLPRLIGQGRAMELLMTGDFVDAAEAHRIGLYNRVVPADELEQQALDWARRLAAGPSLALEVTKRMVLREQAMDLESAMANEVEIQAALMLHPDFREAYEAFRDRRPPRFA